VKTEQDAENDAEALGLRSLGLTYRQIAARLGVNEATAYRRVQRALEAIPFESVEEYRRLENERLDKLLEVAMKHALSEEKGFLQAIDRCLALEERRARLLGLDSTRTVTQTLPIYTGEQLEAEVDRISRLMAANPDFA
jgi:AcrR family transcriptional regulator